jgi:hypothetical protein
MNYKDDISIDPESLDLEWLRHSNKFMKYSKLKAEAKRDLDKAKEKKKTIRSQLILEARKGGENLIGCKPTDSSVEAWYRTQDEYIEAIEELADAEYEFNILEGAVFAFQNRKTALENLVKLMLAGYFAAPKEPKDVNRDWKKDSLDKVSEKQTEKIKTKRRKKNGKKER